MTYSVRLSRTIIRRDDRLSDNCLCGDIYPGCQWRTGINVNSSSLTPSAHLLHTNQCRLVPRHACWTRHDVVYYFYILTLRSDGAGFNTLAKRTQGPLLSLSKLQATETRTGKATQIRRGGRSPSIFLLCGAPKWPHSPFRWEDTSWKGKKETRTARH